MLWYKQFMWRGAAWCVLLGVALAGTASGQRWNGEIRLRVLDESGAAIDASGVLESQSARVRRNFRTESDGLYTFSALPFGLYRLEIQHSGFATQTILVDVHSEAPLAQTIKLGVLPVETAIVVHPSDTLIDPRATGAIQHLGSESLARRRTSPPGRSAVDVVDEQPGWLLEANGVLHPRGSEYDVQYVVDGIPLYDNRSPAFAQSLGLDDFESITVRTANFPAEFGRKLGGVIEINTQRDRRTGVHGAASLQGGSFGQVSGFSSLQWRQGSNYFSLSGEGFQTDRYLDPPTRENFTNHGSAGGFAARFDRDWSAANSTRFSAHRRHTGFLVPNELLQQAAGDIQAQFASRFAGQRQDRSADETSGQVAHTHLLSSRVLLQARAMARDTGAQLWSNALSTPILPFQDRGFREVYAGADLSASIGQHELKAGGDALFRDIHETFSYHIASYRIGGVRIFDRDVPADFHFQRQGSGREQSAFVQDLWRLGHWTIGAGLRFDHYRLVSEENAWSPRLGAAYYIPAAGLTLRASFDRIFQAPAIENVLLASTDLVAQLGGEGAFLPLRPSRGNFVEAGFSKSLWSRLRLEGAWYRRKLDNLADDALLLNTGVSFPIAFRRAEVHGYEARLEIPRWGRFSGSVSYSNMAGRGDLPVAGGLFLGDDAADAVRGSGSFPISQDQRNSVRSRLRVDLHPRVWIAAGASYNSGLPFETEGPADLNFIRQQYGPEILARVNFSRGRVRPSSAIDLSIGAELIRSDRMKLRLQGDIGNLTDRVNVINFAGVFSGTALGPGRNGMLRMNLSF